MDLEKLMMMSGNLGLSKEEMLKLYEQESQRLRDERAAAREAAREAEERAVRMAALEKEKTALQIEKAVQEKELLELRLRAAEAEVRAGSEERPSSTAREEVPRASKICPRKLMATFDDKRDDLDAYLHRFERIASGQGWARSEWATALSLCLVGEALTVFGRMPATESTDYDKVKVTLLQRFRLTAEGFRERFRGSKPNDSETGKQFASRLSGYLDRWIEMSGTEKSYEEIKALMVKEQFLSCCHPKLAIFLKERRLKTVEELTDFTDQFMEAQGLRNLGKAKEEAPKSLGTDTAKQRSQENTHRPAPRCFICNRTGHRMADCRFGGATGKAQLVCQNCNRRGHSTEECRVRTQEKAACVVSPGQEWITATDVTNADKTEGDTMKGNERAKPVIGGGLSMPVVDGEIRGEHASVLRDSGTNTVLVKRCLVKDEELTGEQTPVTLVDGTVRWLPEAIITVSTPYYSGEVVAKCVEEPLYDLILGNISGVRQVDDPDPEWRATYETGQNTRRCGQPEETQERPPQKSRKDEKSKETTEVKALEISNPLVSSAVQTRAATANREKTPKLKVPTAEALKVTPAEVAKQQKDDGSLADCFKTVGEVQKRKKGRTTFEYLIRDNLLYRKCTFCTGREILQLVVPKGLRAAVLSLGHDAVMAGHQGAKSTTTRITEEFFWPGVQSDVKRYVKSCDICQRTIPKGRVGKAPLGSMPTIELPFQRVAIDVIGPISPSSRKGNRYVLTLVDMATRYPDAVALKTITTVEIAEALLEMFARYGVPKEILSDRGSNFTSDLMREINRLMSIQQLLTTPYHPMCNGLVERFNGTIKHMVKKMCQERPADWDRYLPALLFAYREVPQSSLGFSPFEMLYGRTVRGPLAILHEIWTNQELEAELKTTYAYVLELRERLEETCKMAHDNLEKAREKYKKFYDRKAVDRQLKPGDRALILLPSDRNKLTMQWKGPFPVTRKKNDVDYELQLNGNKKVFHINMLKKYEERSPPNNQKIACMVISAEEEVAEMPTCNLAKSMGSEKVIISPELNANKTSQVKALLEKYEEVFSDVPGKTTVLSCKIRLTTEQPVHVRQYPLPLSAQDPLETEVKEMLRMGIIERTESAYNSPLVAVRKADGSYRICVDFRRLNGILIADAEPIPRTDVVFARVAHRKFFSKFDLAKGYWQIPMEEESKDRTAFSCASGLFQFRYMPFGLKTAAATFTKLMRRVLEGIEHVEHYIDDILVATDTWEEHLQVLEKLFQRLRVANLTVKPTKCEVGFEAVSFLGHKIGMGHIATKDEILERIQSAEIPKTKKQVQSFLGLTGYYREFIPRYAEVAHPLVELTKKGAPNTVKWTEKEEAAFRQLKQRMEEPPVLLAPNMSKEFVLRTDASDNALGAVLMQEEKGVLHPVFYASKKLNPCERNYSTIEKECLALVWAVKRFHIYLYGTHFTVQTDHQPLQYLSKSKLSNSRLMRWSLVLQEYEFHIQYIKGKENVGADFMSRLA